MIKQLEMRQEMAPGGVLHPPREALSAGRALIVWLGLSVLGWGVIAALVALAV